MSNIIGKKFGKLLVLEEIPDNRKNKRIMRKIKCLCDCGKEIITNKHHVIDNKVKSCGCIKKEEREKLVGQKFGKLLVLELIENKNSSGETNYKAKCKCDCGNETISFIRSLKTGKAQSCGCRKDQYEKISGKNSKCFTGYKEISGTFWGTYKNRSKKKGIDFNITIEYAWDIFEKQNRRCALTGLELNFGKKGTASIDRIDSNKGYIENNIQWVYKDINIMKNVFNIKYFVEMCTLVSNNSVTK